MGDDEKPKKTLTSLAQWSETKQVVCVLEHDGDELGLDANR